MPTRITLGSQSLNWPNTIESVCFLLWASSAKQKQTNKQSVPFSSVSSVCSRNWQNKYLANTCWMKEWMKTIYQLSHSPSWNISFFISLAYKKVKIHFRTFEIDVMEFDKPSVLYKYKVWLASFVKGSILHCCQIQNIFKISLKMWANHCRFGWNQTPTAFEFGAF